MTLARLTKPSFLAVFLFLAQLASAAAVDFVVPVVVKGTPGLNGSFWDSEVRILRLTLQQDLVVRRKWVALARGGFVDDPATAPVWAFPAMPSQLTARMIVLKGSDLLQGVDATHASVGL